MSNYQATYDAVRNSLRNTDVGQAVRDCCNFDISFAVEQIKQELLSVAWEQQRPCVIHRPTLTCSQGVWMATYGELIGFGSTPAEAMTNFDLKWNGR